MLPRSTSTNPVVLSYYTMLRMVGLLALALPIALATGSILAGLLISGHLPHPLLQRSISDYYYTPMRDLYVGSLCAIAAFLASSRGYDLRDEITGYLAGVCAVGVACFPSFNPRSTLFTHWEFAFGLVHTVFAALMYLTLAYICIFLFRKSSPQKTFTRRKQDRNRIYVASGIIMVACMIAMVSLTMLTTIERRHPSRWLFWCESSALCAFGIAWLTKGEGFMRDKRHDHDDAVRHHRTAESS
jgi:TctA family transporter